MTDIETMLAEHRQAVKNLASLERPAASPDAPLILGEVGG